MNLEEFDIRYTNVLDISYIRRWMQDPRVLYWFPMSTSEEIESALSCWMGFARYNASLTATLQRVPCGIATLFLMPYKKVRHHCFMKVCVDPKVQRQGIGTALLKNACHLAKDYFHLEEIYIEVFAGNPHISLLRKQGFQEVICQERFVKMEGRYLDRLIFMAQLQNGEGYEQKT